MRREQCRHTSINCGERYQRDRIHLPHENNLPRRVLPDIILMGVTLHITRCNRIIDAISNIPRIAVSPSHPNVYDTPVAQLRHENTIQVISDESVACWTLFRRISTKQTALEQLLVIGSLLWWWYMRLTFVRYHSHLSRDKSWPWNRATRCGLGASGSCAYSSERVYDIYSIWGNVLKRLLDIREYHNNYLLGEKFCNV